MDADALRETAALRLGVRDARSDADDEDVAEPCDEPDPLHDSRELAEGLPLASALRDALPVALLDLVATLPVAVVDGFGDLEPVGVAEGCELPEPDAVKQEEELAVSDGECDEELEGEVVSEDVCSGERDTDSETVAVGDTPEVLLATEPVGVALEPPDADAKLVALAVQLLGADGDAPALSVGKPLEQPLEDKVALPEAQAEAAADAEAVLEPAPDVDGCFDALALCEADAELLADRDEEPDPEALALADADSVTEGEGVVDRVAELELLDWPLLHDDNDSVARADADVETVELEDLRVDALGRAEALEMLLSVADGVDDASPESELEAVVVPEKKPEGVADPVRDSCLEALPLGLGKVEGEDG